MTKKSNQHTDGRVGTPILSKDRMGVIEIMSKGVLERAGIRNDRAGCEAGKYVSSGIHPAEYLWDSIDKPAGMVYPFRR